MSGRPLIICRFCEVPTYKDANCIQHIKHTKSCTITHNKQQLIIDKLKDELFIKSKESKFDNDIIDFLIIENTKMMLKISKLKKEKLAMKSYINCLVNNKL